MKLKKLFKKISKKDVHVELDYSLYTLETGMGRYKCEKSVDRIEVDSTRRRITLISNSDDLVRLNCIDYQNNNSPFSIHYPGLNRSTWSSSYAVLHPTNDSMQYPQFHSREEEVNLLFHDIISVNPICSITDRDKLIKLLGVLVPSDDVENKYRAFVSVLFNDEFYGKAVQNGRRNVMNSVIERIQLEYPDSKFTGETDEIEKEQEQKVDEGNE